MYIVQFISDNTEYRSHRKHRKHRSQCCISKTVELKSTDPTSTGIHYKKCLNTVVKATVVNLNIEIILPPSTLNTVVTIEINLRAILSPEYRSHGHRSQSKYWKIIATVDTEYRRHYWNET